METIKVVVRALPDEHFAELLRLAEEQFDVSFDSGGLWRYASTLPETEARRDVTLLQHGDLGEWSLRINKFRGEGIQLICDDAEWQGGVHLRAGEGLTYEAAVRHAVNWLAHGRWDAKLVTERLGAAL
ncbi:hypothetical protein [Sinorhizobium meliloti]|uniref:hypothetical protein n=1 Tax=Rhizobium meliloti TaxID=382 RepID=UPI000FDC092F|nr:hypothetical protein [Sinorhizobium meliloti]RVP99663.1 hypothetical protein CN070_17010 [Sinorhizobium meliloti]